MKKTILMVALLAISTFAKAQTAEVFKPYKPTDLRLPSVPLVVSDPYFSIWSPYDQLNGGSTRHWSNDEKPLDGFLRVDGTTYCFMGTGSHEVLESIVPMADEGAWEAKVTRRKPAAGWEKPEFNDSEWRTQSGAFGSSDQEYVHTRWSETNSDIYVRRTFELTEEQANEDLWIIYSHDDVFFMYVNGEKVADTGETWVNGVRYHVKKGLLKAGKNVIATHTHNTTGGAYTDFGVFRNVANEIPNLKMAEQKSVDVLATSTYYTFKCGPVELDLVFTAPQIIDDLDLMSSPINYISYQVRTTDKKAHDVQFFLSASPLIAVNKNTQATVTTVEMKKGVSYLKTGTVDQPILAKKGDLICIDWGYLYMPDFNGAKVGIGDESDVKVNFAKTGSLPASKNKIVARKPSEMPALAYTYNFGKVETGCNYALIGYDEIQDIQYMHKRYKGYWAHEGAVTIFDMFERLNKDYESIMTRCRQQDKTIYDDGLNASDVKYAELLSGTYRHVNAAHKLFKDDEGHLLYFSKENNSNGCVNTVDLTYPEAPLYLAYNPQLEKAMITSILEYTYTGRWPYAFSAHDLGTYPMADGNVYGDPKKNDGSTMPLEENANIITLAAIIAKLDGDIAYIQKYWDILTLWNQYLVEYGKDPENQLCTDDFKGFSSRNSNLAVKATMGIAAYAEMCKMLGKTAEYDKNMKIAREFAHYFVDHAKTKDGKSYRMEFDGKDSDWSLKYNMVWDQLWGWNLYNDKYTGDVIATEIAFYLKHLNKYGVQLDSRDDTTKGDWVAWTAAMAKNQKDFQKIMDLEYKYVNETATRWPTSDWHHTEKSDARGFRARSVLGGYWMKVLAEKLKK